MEQVFNHLSTSFRAFEETREKLRERRNTADVYIKAAQQAIAKIHVDRKLQDVASASLVELKRTGALVKDIENALPDEPGSFYRYNDIWHVQLQTCAMIAVLIGFIMEDTLVDVDKVVEMMGAEVQLPIEDYLIGVCNVVQELVRLSLNCVIRADYKTPKRCTRFASDVFEGFKQLNLRNDFLRKRYDGIKYDVKRLEEIMYDLIVRGLLDRNSAESDVNMTKEESNP